MIDKNAIMVYYNNELHCWSRYKACMHKTKLLHVISVNYYPDSDWVTNNIKGEYLGVFYNPPTHVKFYFELGTDALAFKLIYG